MPRVSLSLFQAIVGITAGLISIGGAAYSAAKLFRPDAGFGQVAAIVRDAKTGKPVAAATLEILTPEDALVTTRTATNDGRAQQTLREGRYRLRVKHPQYTGETRQIQVVPGQTSEVRVSLAPRPGGGGSAVDQARRTVDEGVGKVQKLWRDLTK